MAKFNWSEFGKRFSSSFNTKLKHASGSLTRYFFTVRYTGPMNPGYHNVVYLWSCSTILPVPKKFLRGAEPKSDMFQGPVTIRNELKGLKRAETPKPSTLPG
jgi:hypothetical protein